MVVRRLQRSTWHDVLDGASKTLQGRQAEVEVCSPTLGSQILADRRPLLGIVYDVQSDTVEIALDGFDHRVHRPLELYVDGPPLGWASLSVIDADGVLRIITVHQPLMLPPAADEGREPARVETGSAGHRRRHRH